MKRTPNGYAPAPGYLQEQMSQMPELWHSAMPELMVYEFDPLLDSSNMTPDNWLMIARVIYDHYADYDGFVVLHGTDTMAYTSSALPFFLQGLQKPVIVTGSQIPLCEVRNDARQNLIASLIIAAYSEISEVCLCFGSNLFRGCRVVKVYSDGLDAFASPNYPPLGEIGTDITIFPERINRTDSTGPTVLQVAPLHLQAVGVLRLFPGISAEVVRNMLRPPLKGLVLETYGAGNAPDNDPQFLEAICQAASRGVVIVNCTQCMRGAVHTGAYETGSSLARAGVISGYDMTVEAALAKLYYLLSTEASADDIKRLMGKNLCGELSSVVTRGSEQTIVLKGGSPQVLSTEHGNSYAYPLKG